MKFVHAQRKNLSSVNHVFVKAQRIQVISFVFNFVLDLMLLRVYYNILFLEMLMT